MSGNIAHDIDSAPRTGDVLFEKCSFEELALKPNLLKALHDCGFETPSPIQYRAIPIGLCGFDLVLQAKSGTGKTLVFGIICLEAIQIKSSDLQALILSPTREIAVQTKELLNQIGALLGNLKAEAFIGGLPIEKDRQKLLGCQIAVGAPGRIKHLLAKRVFNPNKVKILILDEADQLISRNFMEDVKYIYSCLPNKKQIIAASATYSSDFSKFMKLFMKYPSIITPKFEIPTLLGIKQFVSIVDNENDKVNVVEALTNIFSRIVFKQCIIFTNTKSNASVLTAALKKMNWPSEYLTADHDQITRLAIMSKLKSFKCRILVTTDLTARGIDAENVNLVINVEVPLSHATYLHRIGRAGRYGSYGIAITLLNDCKELVKFKSILHKIGGDKMSVNILPEGKIPDLWDLKSKFVFEKLYACPSNEIDEQTYSDTDSQIDCYIGDMLNNDADFEISKNSSDLGSSLNTSHSEDNKSESGGFSDDISKHHMSNGVLQLECFGNLGDYYDSFMKSDSPSSKFTQQDNIEQSTSKSADGDILFDKSEISEKLFNVSMKSEFPVEDLNSLLLNFNKCDISTAKLTGDLGINKKNYHNEKMDPAEEIKPNSVKNDKQSFDVDEASFSKLETTNKNDKNVKSTVACKSPSPEKNSTNEFVSKLREATSDLNEKFLEESDDESEDEFSKNILRKHKNEEKPLPILQPKPVDKKQLDEDRAFLDMIKTKAVKDKAPKVMLKEPVSDRNDHIVKEINDAIKNVDIGIFSTKGGKIVTSPEVTTKTKKSKKKSKSKSMSPKDLDGDRALLEMMKAKAATEKSKSSTTDDEFVTKLRAATSDLNEKLLQDDEEDDIMSNNVLRKHKDEKISTVTIKPKPVNKKQLDDDRAFLDKIKLNAAKEKALKMLPEHPVQDENKQIVKDLDAAMQNIDIDTFSCKDGKIVTSPEIVDNSLSTPKNITGRSVLKAFRKCKSTISDALNTQEDSGTLSNDICDLDENEIIEGKINSIVCVAKSKSPIDTISEKFDNININKLDIENNELSNSGSHPNIKDDKILNARLEQFLSNVDENLEKVNNFLTKMSEIYSKNKSINRPTQQKINDITMLSPKLDQVMTNIDEKLEKVNDFLTVIASKSSHSEVTENSSGYASKSCSKKLCSDKKYDEDGNSINQDRGLDHSGNDKTLDDCCSTLRSDSDKILENSANLKTSRGVKNDSEFKQCLDYNEDPMFAYKSWNQTWMQQVWQINNFVAQNNYCKDTYASYYK